MKEDNTCNTCKHYEWNIIGIDEKHRPKYGRCFCLLDDDPWNIHHKYGDKQCGSNERMKKLLIEKANNSEEE